MRKYMILIFSVIVLLEIATLVIFHEYFVQYFHNSTSSLINAVMPIVIMVAGIAYMFRRR